MQFPKLDEGYCRRMADMAWRRDEALQATDAAYGMRCPQDRRQLRWRFHAVLQGDDTRRWTEKGAHRLCHLGHLPGFHPDQDGIYDAHLCRVVGCLDRLDDEVAQQALHVESVGL